MFCLNTLQPIRVLLYIRLPWFSISPSTKPGRKQRTSRREWIVLSMVRWPDTKVQDRSTPRTQRTDIANIHSCRICIKGLRCDRFRTDCHKNLLSVAYKGTKADHCRFWRIARDQRFIVVLAKLNWELSITVWGLPIEQMERLSETSEFVNLGTQWDRKSYINSAHFSHRNARTEENYRQKRRGIQ